MIWIILIIAIALAIWIYTKLKLIKVGNVVLITGGVKTGKTTLSVHYCLKLLKDAQRKVKFYNYCLRWFTKDRKKLEMPQIYSNIPLAVPYVPLTKDLIYRKKRFAYGSIIYICEASLLASQMDYTDVELSENLALLVKLIAHETKGGTLLVDTQAIEDLHWGIKRNLSSYLYIHHKINLPFFLLLKVREMSYCSGTTNTIETDIERADLQTIIVPKSVWRKFDCYCYSALTDDLEVEKELHKSKSLKAKNILTFRKYREYIQGGKKNNGNEKNTKNN